jgi:hypothetical protein
VRLATEIVRTEKFNEACNNLVDTGMEKFPDFDVALENMKSVGAVGPGADPTFINALLELKEPAKLFHHLGNLPEETARILTLSPTKQVIELARLEEKLAKPKVAQVSKAPAPITPVGGGNARAEADITDSTLPMEEWIKLRDKTRRSRQ